MTSRQQNLKNEIRQAESMQRRAVEDINKQKELIDQMNRQSGDRVRAFGHSMPEILRDIERERGWHSKPIGPFGTAFAFFFHAKRLLSIGMHIKLRYPEWSTVVETLISGALSAFVVENHEDRKRLSQILGRHKWYSSFIVQRHYSG
jgi:chromosome segregation ATPase